MVTNAVYTQLDNIKHSFERFFPSIHLHKQLHNCYIASEAFAWRAGNFILQLHLDFPIWVYGQQETNLLSHLVLCTVGTSENWNWGWGGLITAQ